MTHMQMVRRMRRALYPESVWLGSLRVIPATHREFWRVNGWRCYLKTVLYGGRRGNCWQTIRPAFTRRVVRLHEDGFSRLTTREFIRVNGWLWYCETLLRGGRYSNWWNTRRDGDANFQDELDKDAVSCDDYAWPSKE
jgi:hypothetical protein